ncbi:MAG: hypothetical protein ACR2IJ_04325 [Fluviibacter sp.]
MKSKPESIRRRTQSCLDDPDMQAAPAALARAAKRARDLAAKTKTPLVFVVNGELIQEVPKTSEIS